MKDRFDFGKFAGTSMFPNIKKYNKFQRFLFNSIHYFLCLIGKHELQKCQIENKEYMFCKHCEYTEKNGIKVKRIYNKNVEFL
jgi:hypothetical protein